MLIANTPDLKNKPSINQFISFNKKALEELLNQKETAEIEKILENSHSFTELINKDTFSILRNNIRIIAACSMALMISLNFVYISFYYHLKLFEAENIEEMSFPQRRSRNRGAAAITTVGFFLIFYLAYNISKILFRNINTKNNTVHINIDKFILNCRENTQLLTLIPDPYKNVDDFWFRNISINTYLPRDKNLFMYREYVNTEFERLKKDIGIEPFIVLLTGLIISDSIPNLTDLSYDVPLDILRDPESFWTKNTVLSHIDCKPFLQLTYKIAAIESVEEELNKNATIFSSTRKNILKKLSDTKNSLKLKVTKIKLHSPLELVIENLIQLNFGVTLKRLYILFLATIFVAIKYNSDQNTLAKWEEQGLDLTTIDVSVKRWAGFQNFVFSLIITSIFGIGTWFGSKKIIELYNKKQSFKRSETVEQFLERTTSYPGLFNPSTRTQTEIDIVDNQDQALLSLAKKVV